MHEPGFADLVAARARIGGIIHQTPVLRSASADARAGARLFFKAENFQRTGSFKFRGAVNAIAALAPSVREAGVVAFSSGNHAQAVAAAARHFAIRAVLVMPRDAPPSKRAAAVSYGAEIVSYDRYTEDREAIAARLAATQNLTLIPPFDDAAVIAGQGSCAAELIEQAGPLDHIIACVGGGGLLAGTALAAAGMCPEAEIWGVEPEAGNDVQQSLRLGHRVRIPVPRSIADGALTQQVGALPFALLRRLGCRIATVTDSQLLETMNFLASRLKIVVEPTGCLAAAAILHGVVQAPDARIGIILSGGNTDLVLQPVPPDPPAGLG